MALTVSEQLQHMTVRLESRLSDGRISVGTGFFCRFLQDKESAVAVIVTNHHVIRGAVKSSCRFTVTKKEDSEKPIGVYDIHFPFGEDRWLRHPDESVDLAVIPVGPLFHTLRSNGFEPFYKAVRTSEMATTKDLSEASVLDPIVMVGYPNGLWDQQHNLPIARKGYAATRPSLDYNGKSEFVIDCACFPGSSGSPVFQCDIGNYVGRDGKLVIGHRVKLLGLLYAGPVYSAEGEIIVKEIPTGMMPISQSSIPMNLGYVIKATRLLEMESVIEAKQREAS
jgi:Trypsin-like peptidase domain